MNIGTLLRIAILLCTVSVGPRASAELVTLIGPDITPVPDNRISTITGIIIADGLFDLTFHHGISYDDLQEKLYPTSPITWTTDAEAEVVLAAILAAVNSFGNLTGNLTGDLTNNVAIPLAEPVDLVTAKFGINQDSSSYLSWFFETPKPGSSKQSKALQPNDAWVTATAAVPEPSAFLYLGLVGLGCVAWPTRRANRETQ